MNQHGNIILFLFLGIAAILVLPPIVLYMFPAAKYLFQLIMVFTVYAMVRGYIGEGMITLLITGVLVYFLVFKYPLVTSSVWVFQLLLGVGFTSVVMWGIRSRTMG